VGLLPNSLVKLKRSFRAFPKLAGLLNPVAEGFEHLERQPSVVEVAGITNSGLWPLLQPYRLELMVFMPHWSQGGEVRWRKPVERHYTPQFAGL